MSFEDPIAAILQQRPFVVLDGALATELEARGCDLNHPLWSARILDEDPKAIFDVHLDYFKAGADVATTASYQASIRGLKEHFKYSTGHAEEIIAQSVHLAEEARDKYFSGSARGDSKRRLLIAGSVGPYGAYLADGSEYRGDYDTPLETMKEFHRGRIRSLRESGVDILACETMPAFGEIQALVELLRDEFPNMPAWISCTLRDSSHISDGTPLSKITTLLDPVSQIVAVGINCGPENNALSALEVLQSLTAKPLVVYPNSGETWDAESKTWSGQRNMEISYEDMVVRWYRAGARLIGGCCRTSPRDIVTVRRVADWIGGKAVLESVEE